jgi:hypothetical protein
MIDHSTVAKAWQDYGVAPWRTGTFKFPTDPSIGLEGRRCGGPLPGRTRERGGALRGWEVSALGPGAQGTFPADATGEAGAGHTRLRPARDFPLVRRHLLPNNQDMRSSIRRPIACESLIHCLTLVPVAWRGNWANRSVNFLHPPDSRIGTTIEPILYKWSSSIYRVS